MISFQLCDFNEVTDGVHMFFDALRIFLSKLAERETLDSSIIYL